MLFPSPVDYILSDLSTMTRPSWVAAWAWLSFIELDKAVVHVIRLASCLRLWFQCVCPLTSSLRAHRLIWVSLTLDMGYLLSAATLNLGRGVTPLVLEKAEEPEIKLPTSAGSLKKQESSRKASISGLLTMPKPLICGSQ